MQPSKMPHFRQKPYSYARLGKTALEQKHERTVFHAPELSMKRDKEVGREGGKEEKRVGERKRL